MDIELIDEENNHVKYGIIYTRTDVDDCIEKEAKEMQPEVKANGFRPGKVPVDYILRMYGEKLRIQAMNKKITEDITGIIKSNDYTLASQPIYNFQPRQEEGDTNFYVELNLFLMPELPEIDYSSVKLSKYEPDEDSFQQILDKNLLMFQIMTADFEDLSDEPSQTNDKITFSVEVIVDNEPAVGLSGQMQAILGQEQAPPEIEAQLMGQKAGEEVVYTHKYPEDATDVYAPSLAGTETIYKISIEKVERPIIKELDEARIQKIGFRDYEHLFEILEGNTRESIKRLAFNKMRHDFLTYLRDLYKDIVVPDFIVDQEAHHVAMAELSAAADIDVMKEMTSGMLDLKVTDAHRDLARKNVRLGLFVYNYAKTHNISVTEVELKRELEKHLPELARLNSIKPDFKEENYKEVAARVRASVMEQKVVKHVLEQAKPEEIIVEKDEFFEKVKIAA